jgi:sporulation integral membrane protein YtvI
MARISWERMAAVLICIFLGGGALILFWKYLFPVLIPFIIAWGVSLLVRPLSVRISSRIGVSQRLCAVILLLVFLFLTVFLIGLGIRRLMQELSNLLGRLLENNGNIPVVLEDSFDLFGFLVEKIGLRGENQAQYAAFRLKFNEMLSNLMEHLIEALSGMVPSLAGKLLSSLPTFFFMTLITVIAGFYFCIDGKEIGHSLCRLLPQSIQSRIPAWKEATKRVSWKYIRVYLLLLLFTFLELLIGFLILRVDYAFLLAALIAVLDMLPILGVGTVLVPWALLMLLQKNYYLGFGLLILYFAVLILRQITEPKLVGKSLGVHPLLALFASYAGWRLFGFWGMLLGPIVALLIKNAALPLWRFLKGEQDA